MKDSAQQRELFEQALTTAVYQAAWRYACWLSRTREDAEDLLQESLIRAFQCFHQLRDTQSFRAWLMRIIRTRHLMRRRSDGNGIITITGTVDCYGETLVDYTAAPAAGPLAAELAVAIAGLPAQQREVIVLHYLEGYSLVETGQVLGISANAARQRIHRARNALRGLLERQADPVCTELSC